MFRKILKKVTINTIEFWLTIALGFVAWITVIASLPLGAPLPIYAGY